MKNILTKTLLLATLVVGISGIGVAETQSAKLDYFEVEDISMLAIHGANANESYDAYSKATGGNLILSGTVNRSGYGLVELESQNKVPAFVITEQKR